MKLIKIYISVFFLSFTYFLFSKSVVNVGIYNEGAAVKTLIESIKKNSNYNVDIVKNLDKKELLKYDVLIFSNTGKFSADEKTPIHDIIGFVQTGRGILFIHNACGRYGVLKEPVFPNISSFAGKTDGFELVVVNKKHPISQGLPDKFKHTYWDHITLNAGNDGIVIIKDLYGDPVVIAGKPIKGSDGRVVYMGNIPGIAANEKEIPVKGDELKLLLNSIKWLSGGKHYKYSESQIKNYMVKRKEILEKQKEEVKIDPEKLKKGKFRWKAIYVSPTSPGLYTKVAVKLMMKDLKRMGINAILPYIFGGQAYYLSKLKDVEVFPPYKDTNFDLLKVLCEEGHKNGISVIPVVCPFIEHIDGKPTLFLRKHPEYRQISKYAKIVDGVPTSRPASCPDRPEVRKRYLNVIKEIITRYPVDGISLDYIRYQDDRSCWCPYSIKKRKEFMKKHPGMSEEEAEQEFSRNIIVGFVKNIRKEMDQVNPKLILHAYTHPYYAVEFPLNYHSKRTTSAWWDTKNNKPRDENFLTLEQTYMAAKNLVRISRTYYKYTNPAPMVDIASGTPPDIIWKEIRTVAKAGARDIVLMGYNVNAKWFSNWESVEKVKKVVSEELGGKWCKLSVPADIIPHIKAKPNLLPNGSFENWEGEKLKNIFIEGGKITKSKNSKYGEVAIELKGKGAIHWKPVKIKPLEIYTLSAWVKSKGENNSIRIYLYFLDKNLKPKYVRFIHLPDKMSPKNYYKIEITRTSLKNTPWAKIRLLWNCPEGGSIFLDGVKLENYPVGTEYE